jgi:hypothetical protein
MNKKIIAIAIATAMTAPAAMADVKVGGQIGAAFISASKGYTIPTNPGTDKDLGEVNGTDAYRAMSDSGLSKIEFSGNAGDAVFKIGMDIRPIMGGGATAGRDFWLGHKLGAGTLTFGRMPAALAGIEGDKYNATFLELRRTAAVATTANDSTDTYFGSPIIQYAMKAGGAAIKIQYDAQDKSDASADEGYYAVSVKGAAGAVGYFAGVNNGSGTDVSGNKEQNIKAGASMKFGAAKVTLMLMNADNNSVKSSATTVMADMGLGNGLSLGVAYGMQGSGTNNKDTFMRLAATKDLGQGASIFGGYAAKHDDSAATNKDTNALGVGMKIKF